MFASATLFLIGIVVADPFGSSGSTDHIQVLEFSAASCGACRQMQPTVAAARAEGISIHHVDVNSQRAQAHQWRVTQIPTYVAIRNGQEVGRVVGATSLERLRLLAQPSHSNQTYAVRGQSPPAAPAERTSAPQWNSSTSPVSVQATPPTAHAVSSIVPTSSPNTTDAAEARCLAATVRLRVEDEQGHSFGSGTIIDMHGNEALVLTCGHIFRESQGHGRIVCDSFAPGAQQEVSGTLVSFDLRRDIALVSFEPGVTIDPAPVGRAADQPQTNDVVFSIGCNHGEHPSFIRNKILAVNRYHGPANLVVGGRPVDGRSGGGLFSADGTLVGVCNAADQQANEGVYAALGPIQAELDEAGLDFVYRGTRAIPHDRVPEPAADHTQTSTVIAPPVADNSPRRATPTAEVIYIWRGSNPESDRKVVVIDQPSDALLQNIHAEINRRGPHAPTRHQVADHELATPTHSAGGWSSAPRK